MVHTFTEVPEGLRDTDEYEIKCHQMLDGGLTRQMCAHVMTIQSAADPSLDNEGWLDLPFSLPGCPACGSSNRKVTINGHTLEQQPSWHDLYD